MTFEQAHDEYLARIDKDGGKEFAKLVGETQEEVLIVYPHLDIDEGFTMAVSLVVGVEA